MIPALIIPTLNQHKRLRDLLLSIDHPIGELIIIDNGHRHARGFELRPCIDDLFPDEANITVLPMPANLGVAGSWNLGIKCAPHVPWWLIANDDIRFPPGALADFATSATSEGLLLSSGSPPWCCFAIGEQVVATVGLFDERFHPAYFEDTDYRRRADQLGVPVSSGPWVEHFNSSTLESGYGRNEVTFHDNAAFHQRKVDEGDISTGWSLTRRRNLKWE